MPLFERVSLVVAAIIGALSVYHAVTILLPGYLVIMTRWQ